MSTDVRTNPLVRVRPARQLDPPSLVIEIPQTRSQLRVGNYRLCSVLAEVGQWTSAEAVAETIGDGLDLSPERAVSLTESLIEHGVLLTEDDDLSFSAPTGNQALHYHLWVHDYPFVDMSDIDEAVENDRERMAAYKEADPVPSSYRDYPTSRLIDLPEPANDAFDVSINEVLFDSDTDDGDGIDSLSVQSLSDVLYYVFGQTGTQTFPVQGDFPIKTSPSGGSRHPTECYVVCRDVVEVPTGIYHYSVRSHALETVRSDVPSEVESLSPNDAPVTLVLTSVVERNMWRYREPRTYRVLLHDIGHLLQTLRCVSMAHERLSSVVPSVQTRPASVESVLDLHPLVEPVIASVELK